MGGGAPALRLHLPGRARPLRARPHQPGPGQNGVLHRAAEPCQEHFQVKPRSYYSDSTVTSD